ncbi:hypothetical protein V6N11_014985 [Hibiscus sabdariffa]|uniref:Phosphatidic acid phosphatase type 2/haloperoxidase domain-containing protein n=1 Tax=Hibiscus sabdariffa TaxID=183260 RepID=A0ABR2TQQ3_9ROSI
MGRPDTDPETLQPQMEYDPNLEITTDVADEYSAQTFQNQEEQGQQYQIGAPGTDPRTQQPQFQPPQQSNQAYPPPPYPPHQPNQANPPPQNIQYNPNLIPTYTNMPTQQPVQYPPKSPPTNQMYANVGPQVTPSQTGYAPNVSPQAFPQQARRKMTDISLGTHTIKSHGVKVAREHLHSWLMLILLALIDGLLNYIEPFHRFIGQDMMTDLKFPFHKDTIPMWAVPVIVVFVPFFIFGIYYYWRRDVYDLHHAVLGILYSVLLTGVITDSIKDAVGRPRPNFFYRCFPDGKAVFSKVNGDVVCHGDAKIIKEGYKSFPSGHTSWSFAGLCFLSWYLSGKIRAFDREGHVAKNCIVIIPVLIAVLIGISRVDDYWHHWTDVFAGALIGSSMAAFCYLQFFPFPHYHDGWAPHAYFKMIAERQRCAESPESAVTPLQKDHPDIELQPMS